MFSNTVMCGQMRVGLEDHAHPALLGIEEHALRRRGEQRARRRDLARVGRLEAGDEPQRGRLAAAARPEQGHERPGRDVEVHVVDGGRRSEGLREPDHPDVLHALSLERPFLNGR